MVIQKIIRVAAFLSLCLFATFSSYTHTDNKLKTHHSDVHIVSDSKNVIKKSLNSSVRVLSSFGFFDQGDVTSSSSGTYLIYNNEHYIITTAHSLIGDCETTLVLADEILYNCIEIMLLDHQKDLGILKVEKIINRKPIKIMDFLNTDNEVFQNTGVNESIIYTGYPQGLGPLTFEGKIVSHRIENGIFFGHSYAWAGSSGSGLFNSKGKLVGIISAVSVANTEYGVDVMEDLIIITSLRTSDIQETLKGEHDVREEDLH